MLYNPTHNAKITEEEEYFEKITSITNTLKKCAVTGFFESFDGGKMYYEYYKNSENRASIVVVHGYTEFSAKYYELAWHFLEEGYNVFVYDLRGHGFSHRQVENLQMSHVDRFEDYVEDLNCFINKIVLPNSENAPIYLFSHSMGGAIATLYLSSYESSVEKAILSSPMVYPVCTPLPSFVLRRLLVGEAKKYGWSGKFKFSSDFNPDAKSNNRMDLSRARFEYNLNLRIGEPHYQNSSSSIRWNYEVLGIKKKILNKKSLKNITQKVLLISAGKDTVVKIPPQKRLAKMLNCEFVCFEDSKHSIYTMTSDKLGEYIKVLTNFFSA